MSGQEDILSILRNLLDHAEAGEIEALTFGVVIAEADSINCGVVGDLSTEDATMLIGYNRVVEHRLTQFVINESELSHSEQEH